MAGMHLYEISEEMQKLMDAIEDQEGEIFDEQYELMKTLELEGKEKIESIAKVILNERAVAKARADEAKRQRQEAQRAADRAAYLEEYVMREMDKLELTEVAGDVLSVKIPKPLPSVELEEFSLVPIEYVREIPATAELDKRACVKHYKDTGLPVPGTRVNLKRTLRIK